MAQFTDVTVSGLLTAFLIKAPMQASALGLTESPDVVSVITGTNHNLALPGLSNGGPCLYQVHGAGSPVIGGIQTDAGALVSEGQVIALVNTGSVDILTAALDSGSSTGNKISVAVTIPAGSLALFVYVGGIFYPLYTIAS
jgi:hypothetical protein